ncbi:MAG: restriction endonuclease subunit S [Blautia sp.]|nr:restriction endonuclease subunit S [Blautia sp.]
MARTGNTIGVNKFIDREVESVYNNGLIRIKVDEKKVMPKYFYYIVRGKECQNYIQSIAYGTSTQPNMKIKDFLNFEAEILEKSRQKKVVEIIDALERKMILNNEINDNLLEQAQILYKKFFPYGIFDELPNGWRIGTIGEIIEIHDSKRIPLSGAARMKMKKKIYPYYGAASLMDYVDNFIFEGKYLLLGEDGTVINDSGYPILQYVWGQFWVNNHAHILTGKLGFNVESLYMLLRQTSVKSIVTGAVQPKISQANLRSVQVVIPPEKILLSYNDQVGNLFTMIRANEEENELLSVIRDVLLPKLMSGEIDLFGVNL